MSARPYIRILLLALLGACSVPTGPAFPDGVEPFEPPAIYEAWWRLTEACSGRSADYRAVRWYVMNDADRLPGKQGAVAAWFPDGNRIVLTEGARLDGTLVRHEMLHSLLGVSGNDHPRAPFISACGGVVACSGECEAEAGNPDFPPIADRVNPSVLTVDVSVYPSHPSSAAYDGHYFMVVAVQHTGDQPVEVNLPDASVAGWKIGPDLEARGGGAPVTSWRLVRSPETARFAPGETKRFVYDFRVGRRNQYGQMVPSGTWTFHGAFGGESDPQPPVVTVGP